MISAGGPMDARCECCGATAITFVGRGDDRSYLNARCNAHVERNPCAIEGCRRTSEVKGAGYGNDQWLCAEHWRRYVPPHSKVRRAYHRFWRIAKRTGWTDDLIRRFWRFWNGLIKRARREAGQGRIDPAEINQLFGWDAD